MTERLMLYCVHEAEIKSGHTLHPNHPWRLAIQRLMARVDQIREFLEQWNRLHPQESVPRDWYRSWELYVGALRLHSSEEQ